MQPWKYLYLSFSVDNIQYARLGRWDTASKVGELVY